MTWEDLKNHDINVYSTPWCGDCRTFKNILKENDIAFTEIDIDSDAKAAAYLEEKTGRKAIPFAEIDSKAMIRGWHKEVPGRFSDDLFLSEVAEAID